MKMKNLALLLSFVMLFSANAFASSTNSVSGEGGAYKEETPLTHIYFNIKPNNEVTTGSSIFITFETAKVMDQAVIDGTSTDKEAIGYNGSVGYQYSFYDWNPTEGFYDVMPDVTTSQLPYYIRRVNDYQIEVDLCNVPDRFADVPLSDLNGVSREPYYHIPAVVYTYGTGDVKATIDSNSTSISGGRVLSNSTNSGKKETTTNASETTTKAGATESTTEATTSSTEKVNTVKATIGSDVMLVNNSEFTIDVAPYVQKSSSSTLMPLRAVTTALAGNMGDGKEIVFWDAETKTVTIEYKGHEVKFTAGSDQITINGTAKTMDNGVVAEITNERMFVPFRALGEALGAKVSWDAETKTAIYN